MQESTDLKKENDYSFNVMNEAPQPQQVSAAWKNGIPTFYEKLWRGLAIVFSLHLIGLLINNFTQMGGSHFLDQAPAMFLGL